jgi:hypothetical protein
MFCLIYKYISCQTSSHIKFSEMIVIPSNCVISTIFYETMLLNPNRSYSRNKYNFYSWIACSELWWLWMSEDSLVPIPLVDLWINDVEISRSSTTITSLFVCLLHRINHTRNIFHHTVFCAEKTSFLYSASIRICNSNVCALEILLISSKPCKHF